jgi:hypothetical protein
VVRAPKNLGYCFGIAFAFVLAGVFSFFVLWLPLQGVVDAFAGLAEAIDEVAQIEVILDF